jgi:hypothetical protein
MENISSTRGMDIYANDVVYAREIERRKCLHREWVAATKPTSQTNGVVLLDQRRPETLSPRYNHLRYNPKKVEKQNVWQSRVNHQNKVLLERMIKISTTQQTHHEIPYSMKANHEHNERVRRRRMKQVYSENVALSKRLQSIKPSYPNTNWAIEAAKQKSAADRISRNRTLGYLSPEKSGEMAGGHPLNSGGSSIRNVREGVREAGLFGYDIDGVQGSHLWEGPSMIGCGSAISSRDNKIVRRGGGRGKRRKKFNGHSRSLQHRHHGRQRVENLFQEKEWNASTNLNNPSTYATLFERATKLFDVNYLDTGSLLGKRGGGSSKKFVAAAPKGSRGNRGNNIRPHGRIKRKLQTQRQQQQFYHSPFTLGGSDLNFIREELLFQGRKDSLDHLASLTFFERTEKVREAMDETAPGLTFVKATKSNGFRVVAHLAAQASTVEDSNSAASYQPMMGSGGTAVQQVGLMYLIIVLQGLASGTSGDAEVAQVAQKSLQALQDATGTKSIKQSLLHHDEEGELLKQFAQLLMLISDTTPETSRIIDTAVEGSSSPNRRKATVVVPATVVLGKHLCPALHFYAARIQSVIRGMLGRIRFFHLLQRTINTEKKIMVKESRRRYRQQQSKARQAELLSSVETLSPSAKQIPSKREQMAIASVQTRKVITSPLNNKPNMAASKKIQRPSNQPGRTRPQNINVSTNSFFQRPGRQNVVSTKNHQQQLQKVKKSPTQSNEKKKGEIFPRRPSPSKKNTEKTNKLDAEPEAILNQQLVSNYFDNSGSIGSGGSSLAYVPPSENQGGAIYDGKKYTDNSKNTFVAGNITDGIESVVNGGVTNRDLSESQEKSQEVTDVMALQVASNDTDGLFHVNTVTEGIDETEASVLLNELDLLEKENVEEEASLLEELLSLELEMNNEDNGAKNEDNGAKNDDNGAKNEVDVPQLRDENSEELSLLEELDSMLLDESGDGALASAAKQNVPKMQINISHEKKNKVQPLRRLESLERMEKEDLENFANLPLDATEEEQEKLLHHLANIETAVAEANGEVRYSHTTVDPSSKLLNKVLNNDIIDATENLHAVSERDRADNAKRKRERIDSKRRLTSDFHGRSSNKGGSKEERNEMKNRVESKQVRELETVEEKQVDGEVLLQHTDELLLNELDSFLLDDSNDKRELLENDTIERKEHIDNEKELKQNLDSKSLELLAELEEHIQADEESKKKKEARSFTPDSEWIEYQDEESGKSYFFNTKTQETTWKTPNGDITRSASTKRKHKKHHKKHKHHEKHKHHKKHNHHKKEEKDRKEEKEEKEGKEGKEGKVGEKDGEKLIDEKGSEEGKLSTINDDPTSTIVPPEKDIYDLNRDSIIAIINGETALEENTADSKEIVDPDTVDDFLDDLFGDETVRDTTDEELKLLKASDEELESMSEEELLAIIASASQ